MNAAISVTIVLLLSTFTVRVHAQSMEMQMHQASDLGAYSLFLLNPALPRPSDTVAAFGGSYYGKLNKVNGEEQPTILTIGAALFSNFGGSLGMGITAQQISWSSNAERARNDQSAQARYFGGRLGFNLASKMRVGLAMRYYSVQAEQVISTASNATKIDGYVLGYGAGVIWGSEDGGFGITYLPAMRGKTDADGENLIAAKNGLVSLDGFGSGGSNNRFGVGIQTQLQASDPEADFTGIDNSIAPLSISAGGDYHHSGKSFSRLNVVKENWQGFREFESEDGQEAQTDLWRLKYAFGFDANKWEALIGAMFRAESPLDGMKVWDRNIFLVFNSKI